MAKIITYPKTSKISDYIVVKVDKDLFYHYEYINDSWGQQVGW